MNALVSIDTVHLYMNALVSIDTVHLYMNALVSIGTLVYNYECSGQYRHCTVYECIGYGH